jgi:hypothetical protein
LSPSPTDEDSRSQLTPVQVPKGKSAAKRFTNNCILGKEMAPEFSAPKNQKLTDLDEENIAQTDRVEDPNATIGSTHYIVIPSYGAF